MVNSYFTGTNIFCISSTVLLEHKKGTYPTGSFFITMRSENTTYTTKNIITQKMEKINSENSKNMSYVCNNLYRRGWRPRHL